MGFVEKNLTANERVQYTGKIHWFIYVRTLMFFVIGALSISASNSIGALFILLGVASLIFNLVLVRSTEFAITNRRVILKTGMFSRKITELQLNRSEGLTIGQGIMGRMFNFGSIKITTGGVAESFPFLADPFAFKKEVNQAIEDSYTNTAAPTAKAF